MEERAEAIFAEIDRMGDGSILEGVLAGIERGWFQQAIAESAFREQRRHESGDLTRVGVNAFVDPDDEPVDTLVIGPEGERAQVESLAQVRADRDRWRFGRALDALVTAAGTDANLIPHLVDCARNLCTEGEIVDRVDRRLRRLSRDAALLSRPRPIAVLTFRCERRYTVTASHCRNLQLQQSHPGRAGGAREATCTYLTGSSTPGSRPRPEAWRWSASATASSGPRKRSRRRRRRWPVWSRHSSSRCRC